jgi:hypothetical protein
MTICFIERIVYLFLICPSALLSLYPYDETDGRICDTRGALLCFLLRQVETRKALPCLQDRHWSMPDQAFGYGGQVARPVMTGCS